MRPALATSIVAASVLLLAACTPPEIKITSERVNGPQIIKLAQDWGLVFSRKKAPCVDSVDVRESGPKGS